MDLVLEHLSTNEDLETILKFLILQPEDRVLAIAGSGDQAFAMLENASVIAVDINPAQIDFMRQRAKSLADGDYERFLMPNYGNYEGCFPPSGSMIEKAHNYFNNGGRLARLRSRIKSLEICDATDIFEAAESRDDYSKIYLSNAMTYSLESDGKYTNQIKQRLKRLSRNLPIGGLVHVADHSDLSFLTGCQNEFPSFLPNELVLDTVYKANEYSHEGIWGPAIYRKIPIV